VLRPIQEYAAGRIALAEVARWFAQRPWPQVPPAFPPEQEQAASAIDDPEPYLPGSFDDVARAYDLGLISDADYDVLAHAVHRSRAPMV
jgi:hypothetical protein